MEFAFIYGICEFLKYNQTLKHNFCQQNDMESLIFFI